MHTCNVVLYIYRHTLTKHPHAVKTKVSLALRTILPSVCVDVFSDFRSAATKFSLKFLYNPTSSTVLPIKEDPFFTAA